MNNLQTQPYERGIDSKPVCIREGTTATDSGYLFCKDGYLPKTIYVDKMEDMGKGKWKVSFDTGVSCVLYRGELRGLRFKKDTKLSQGRLHLEKDSELSQAKLHFEEEPSLSQTQLHLKEGSGLSQAQYEYILYDIVAKRAKKRVLYLLEKMDRTEHQIREKLKRNEYPDCCIEIAIEYARSFHYLDDYRYACTFVRYHMEKYSRMQLKQKLISKGISRENAELAINEEYISEEKNQIQALLQKKKFNGQRSDSPEFRRMYQFLLRRGFKSSDILKEMNSW